LFQLQIVRIGLHQGLMISDGNPHAEQSAQKKLEFGIQHGGSVIFCGKKRITTYTRRVFKMDSTNVKIFCVVNESFEKK